jgi:hypothetical protein
MSQATRFGRPARRNRRLLRAVLIALLAIAVPRFAHAQRTADARLDGAAAAAIERIVAGAAEDGLPVEPLRDKVAEGLSKGAGGALIVRAVERLRDRLALASSALGGDASAPDLVAAAALLDLGVTEAHLQQIRSARPDRPVASALVGLAFLIQRGAGTDGAVSIVYDMLVARVSDSEFDRFRETVARDIEAGAPVTGAARARASAAILRVRGGSLAPGGAA